MGIFNKQESAMKRHAQTLGKTVRDKVTGLEGVATSLAFDLYGCVQIVVTPPAKDGKTESGYWYDVSRLEIVNNDRVMDLPDFDAGYIADGKKGPADKPLR